MTMHDKLKGKFVGYETGGVIVAASSPVTESAEKVLKCQENGAAAAILKTASKMRVQISGLESRRCFVHDGLFWAKSSYSREILTMERGEALVKDCKAAGVTIPISASVTELTLSAEDWIEDCVRMEAAGANAIQLDFFYIENLLTEYDFENRFVSLLTSIRECLRIPVMPKLNISLPAAYAASLFKRAGIQYVSLLDAIKTPVPAVVSWRDGSCHGRVPSMSVRTDLAGGGLSVFGSFMFPITAQYAHTFSRAGFEVCAGGGVVSGENVANLLLHGASSVQVATDVLLNGYERFATLNEEIDAISQFALSAHFCGRDSLSFFHEHGRLVREESSFGTSQRAHLRPERCNPADCGKRCVRQTFCSSVRMKDEYPSFTSCEGCGLCTDLCPNDAIEMGDGRFTLPK